MVVLDPASLTASHSLTQKHTFSLDSPANTHTHTHTHTPAGMTRVVTSMTEGLAATHAHMKVPTYRWVV